MFILYLRIAGACFKEKAYVQKELAAGTGLMIGVPFYAKDSGRPFPEAIYNYK